MQDEPSLRLAASVTKVILVRKMYAFTRAGCLVTTFHAIISLVWLRWFVFRPISMSIHSFLTGLHCVSDLTSLFMLFEYCRCNNHVLGFISFAEVL